MTERATPQTQVPTRIPLWSLLATLAMQTLATMAAFSLPAAAPEMSRDLGVEGTLVGFFISIVYGVGIGSALLSPGFIHRYGGVRVGQVVMLAVVGMLATAATGSLYMVVVGGIVLGLGYGATAPVSTHLLVPRTPPKMFNLVLSIRQIGVPLGGVLSGLVVPPLVLAFGWQSALLAQLLPAALLLVLLQFARANWDADREPGRPVMRGSLAGLVTLLRADPVLRNLSITCFFYAGIQLCFISFTAVHLTDVAGIGLIAAGQALATYHVSGVVSRPIWGLLADRVMPARPLLALQGFIMAGAALAAGQFGPGWPFWLILIVCSIAGATASGFTGIAYGEFARQGGARRTEATAVGSGAMFAGVLILPSCFGVAVTALGHYGLAYAALAAVATAGGLLLLFSRRPGPSTLRRDPA